MLWDERVAEGWVFASDGKLRTGFSDHFNRNFPNDALRRSRTDVENALELFLEEATDLVGWYKALVSPPEILIDWRDQQPLIAPNSISAWEQLSGLFDQDALLSSDLVRVLANSSCDGPIAALGKWRTVPRVTDYELSVIWSRGISDLHVHVGGVRLPQQVWLEFMAHHSNLAEYQDLDKIYKSARRSLKQEVTAALQERKKLQESLVKRKYFSSVQRQNRGVWWTWTKDNLLPEREMLVAAWEQASKSRDRALLGTIDTYLSYKHRFFRFVRQQTFASQPGLREFDQRYFSALKRKPARDGAKWNPKPNYGVSKRREMRPYGDACQYLAESPTLDRIELRIAPFERASNYLRFFRCWREVEAEFQKVRERKVTVRFAVHFKRSRERGQRAKRIPNTIRKLVELDRQTSALRLALSDDRPERRSLMGSLSRVDVAGQERDTPLALFTRHLMLLRGDLEALRYLEETPDSDPFSRWTDCWRRLRRRSAHRPRLDERRLGMTLHAGEDFGDLLDGLYQVGVALNHFHLSHGDGIGHALVLASEFETAGVRDPRYVMISRGAAHDSLCWLLHVVGSGLPARREFVNSEPIRAAIRRSAGAIYGAFPQHLLAASADDHVWVWRHSTLPIAYPQHAYGLRKQLLDLQWTDHVLGARERVEPADPVRRELDALVCYAQKLLLATVKEKRVVIEMNPASNMRVTGSASTHQSPTVTLFQAVADGLLACINTDNPGVFTSCIENEYALLLDGARNTGMSSSEARDLLDRVRRIGMELVYWP